MMVKELLYELSRGFAYRQIHHSEMLKYTTWLPLFLYALTLAIYMLLPVTPIWLGEDGVAGNLLSVLSTLPGFYFAGLAAVATFGGAHMDTIPDAPPEIDIRVRGKLYRTPLTRRRFLSYLFSYLVVLSLIMCFGLIAMAALKGSIAVWHTSTMALPVYGPWIWLSLKFVVISAFSLAFASIVVTTLHGIFLLSERIHEPL